VPVAFSEFIPVISPVAIVPVSAVTVPVTVTMSVMLLISNELSTVVEASYKFGVAVTGVTPSDPFVTLVMHDTFPEMFPDGV